MTEKCSWTIDTDFDSEIYETGCGQAFTFNDGGPAENNFNFCPYCGKPIETQQLSTDWEKDEK